MISDYPVIEVKIYADGGIELRHRNAGGRGHKNTTERPASVSALCSRLTALDPAPLMPSRALWDVGADWLRLWMGVAR